MNRILFFPSGSRRLRFSHERVCVKGFSTSYVYSATGNDDKTGRGLETFMAPNKVPLWSMCDMDLQQTIIGPEHQHHRFHAITFASCLGNSTLSCTMQHAAFHRGQCLSLTKVQTAKHHGNPSHSANYLQTRPPLSKQYFLRDNATQLFTFHCQQTPAAFTPAMPLAVSRKYKFSCPDRCHGVSSLPSSRN